MRSSRNPANYLTVRSKAGSNFLPSMALGPQKLSSTLCGIAGEYLVAAELSRRGYIASITLRNTRGVDILTSDADAIRSVGIQVKTTQGSKATWMLKSVAERDQAANLFYVFVALNGLEVPTFHIVPSADVARFVRRTHREWLGKPRRDGQPRKDTDRRIFSDLDGKYRGQWDLLGLNSHAIRRRSPRRIAVQCRHAP